MASFSHSTHDVQELLPGLSSTNLQTLEPLLLKLDHALTLRTYLSGYQIGPNDERAWISLRSNKVTGGLIQQQRMPTNVSRWLAYLDTMHPEIQKEVKAAQLQAKASRAAASRAGGSYSIGLPDTENGVVTRFPPEPSGYLHIGHAKAAILNDYFAHEAHQGKLIVRFDDTNPATEKQEYEDSILADLEVLGIHPDQVTHTSDYFTQLSKVAEQMISDGNAYADDTPVELIKEQRASREPSQSRDRPASESLAIYKDMLAGADTGKQFCLRARLDFDSVNGALRDPIIYRFPNFRNNEKRPHYRTGWKWKIYPTYDFACPVIDAMEGVTHALRTTEYTDRNEQYQWFLNTLKLRQVHVWDFARINFVRTFLSKRKLQEVINTGLVSGWDDPRMPTVRGIVRRGLTVAALRQFMLKQGPSRNTVSMDWTILWALNQKIIEPTAIRLTAVETEGMVPTTISNGPAQLFFEPRPKHPKQPQLGTKPVAFSTRILLDQADAATFSPNEEITLMKWGNAVVERIDRHGDTVVGLELRLHLEGDFRKTDKKVTWLAVADAENQLVGAQLWTFDHLLNKDALSKKDDLQDCLTKESAVSIEAVCDAVLAESKEGDIVQLERKGFFRVDKTASRGPDGKAVLFRIPTSSKT